VLVLLAATNHKPQAASWLLDIAGRGVLDLRPGASDVRRLVAGVYPIRSAADLKPTRLVLIR
jgi:hypothetical protein